MNVLLAVISLYLTVVLIPLFAYYYYWNPWGLSDPEQVLIEAQTMVFITLVLAELVNAFNCRSDYLSLFKVGVFTNRFLILSGAGLPGDDGGGDRMGPAGRASSTPRRSRWQDWLLAAVLSLTLVPVVELTKWIIGRRGRTRRQTALAE